MFIRTEITLSDGDKYISQKSPTGDAKRENIFAVAYGAGRTISGMESFPKYTLGDSLCGLFNYEYSLQNPELMARRIRDEDENEWNALQDVLKEIFNAEKGC